MKSIWFATLWLVFNVSLVLWWTLLGIRRDPHASKMLLSEGAFLVLSLILGGLAFIRLILKERHRVKRLRDFYAAFSHELKTPIASLRLQVESLMDGQGLSSQQPVLKRLFSDSVRLEHQLENALALAEVEDGHLFLETLTISELLSKAQGFWDSIEIIDRTGGFTVRADRRVLERILNNLIQNALKHGKAQRIEFIREGDFVITVVDDGVGFVGDFSKLGQAFHRQGVSSGSGVGVYLIHKMMEKINGYARFSLSSLKRPNELKCELFFAPRIPS